MHSTTRILAISTLLLVTAVGCSNFGSGDNGSSHETPQGKVAIIDLDLVARQIGYDQQIASAIQQQKTSLEQQLGAIKASYVQELKKRQSDIGEAPTNEQKQFLSKSELQANRSLIQQKRKADVLLTQYRAQLAKDFRERVKPIARQVATEMGLSIILTKNDSVVFDYDMTVDISNTVAERMRSEQPNPPSYSPQPSENTGQSSTQAPTTPTTSDPSSDYGRP